MILDKVFNGILDQGAGCLIVFDDISPDQIYGAGIDTIKMMGHVVDSLFEKAAELS